MPGALPNTKGSDPKGKADSTPIEGSFSFLCLHAAVALTPLLPKAHSLLLTSGTLSPVAPLVAELGLGTKAKRQDPALPQAEAVSKTGLGEVAVGSVAAVPAVHDDKAASNMLHSPTNLEAASGNHEGSQLRQSSQQQAGQHQSSQQHFRQHPSQHHGDSQDKQTQPGHHQLPTVHQPDMQPDEANKPTSSEQRLAAVQPGSQEAHEQQRAVYPAGLPSLTAAPKTGLGHNPPRSGLPQSLKQESAPSHAHQSSGSLPPAQTPTASSEHQSSTVQVLGAASPPMLARSQYASLHQGVELVSAPHHHTLASRLLPLTISMAPGVDGQLVKLDSAYERRQDAGGLLCVPPQWHAVVTLWS